MDALEEVGVGRIGVDPTLRAGAGQREGGLHAGLVLEADDRRDALEPFEILRRKVEHRSSMAEDAGVDIDDDIATGRLGRHRLDPDSRFAGVDLDAQSGC